MIKFKIYLNMSGEWHWHAVARNGRIVADGGEGYKRRADLIKTLRKLFEGSVHWAELIRAVERK